MTTMTIMTTTTTTTELGDLNNKHLFLIVGDWKQPAYEQGQVLVRTLYQLPL